MSFRPVALLCLLGAAACSHNNPEPASAEEVNQTNTAQYEPSMTPASLDTSRAANETTAGASSPATTPIGASDTHASDARSPSDTRGATDARGTTDARAPLTGTSPGSPPATGVAPDNTKVNERDRNSSALTPLDQKENETDLKITQRVRQAVMADGSLSFTAKNVKIITQDGKVTLRGPVKTTQERDAIAAAARNVAGVTQVDNQLEVKK